MLSSPLWRALPALRTAAVVPTWQRFAASLTCETLCLSEVRGVIRLQGEGVVEFLQGLVTNDVAALERAGAPPLYACLLNAQGRYLHDMLLFRTADAVPTVLMDTDRQGKDDLLRLLKRYKLRLKIGIEDVSDSHDVWVRFGSGAQEEGSSGVDGTCSWPADPRLQALGLRMVLPSDEAPSSSSSSSSSSSASWQKYQRWRVEHGIAEGDSEIPTGEVIPLEFNIDGLHGISFKKGCYVGQETMARAHFKGVVRKRLMPFKVTEPQAGSGELQLGQRVFLDDGAALGTIRVVSGDVGLAVLRLAKVLPAVEAGQLLRVETGSGQALVRAWRPEWWPLDWGTEEQLR